MFGKGALIFVIGFGVIFSIYQVKLNTLAVSASDNFNQNYIEQLVHEHANSAMNMAINDLWQTENDSDDFTIITPPCTSVVTVRGQAGDTIKVKVTSRSRVYDEDSGGGTGGLAAVEDSMIALFSYTRPVSRYFWYTNQEGHIYWTTGDTVWGPVHSNDRIRTHGTPVFYGKVTATRGITPPPGTWRNRAHYYGGYEIGPYAELPTDMSPLITAAADGAGGAPVNTKSVYDSETHFEFLPNGDVVREVVGAGTAPDTVALTDIAPTGVIYVNDDVRMKGTLNGQVTVYSTQDVYFEDNMVYADDPLSNPSSDDVLGVVSDNNVIVAQTAANNNDFHLQGSVLAINGSFGAENYSGRPQSGTLYLTGSIAQDQRGPVGTFGNHGINHGYQKNYKYDPRLASMNPPHYPWVRVMNLIAWWE